MNTNLFLGPGALFIFRLLADIREYSCSFVFIRGRHSFVEGGSMYTAGAALIEALHEAGVSFIFANLGSDHPAIVESLAEASATGRPAPKLITCPNEMVALSAAHGFAQVTGRAQAVLVHVECGTQALAGALHNTAKGRVPVLIFAGPKS